MLPELKASVFTHYPRGLKWGDSGWLVSDEITRLIEARRKAEQDTRIWYGFQDLLKEKFPDLDFLAFANLKQDCCYKFLVLLHPGVKCIHDDRAIAQALDGRMIWWQLYISCLGKWVYHQMITMKVIDLKTDKLEFTKSREYQGLSLTLVEKYRAFWESKGYQDIPKELAMEVVSNVATECQPIGRATIFNCLFSDTDSP